jgi:hypothetical protein
MEQRIETESLDIEQIRDEVKNPARLVVIAGGMAINGVARSRYQTPPTYPNDREWAQTNLLS